MSDEILQVHGVLPGRKDDGIIRLLYENTNGIPNRLGGNKKLDKAKELIDEIGTDVVAYNKHRQNLHHKDNQNGWNQLFRGGNQTYAQSSHTMNMKQTILGECRRGVRDYYVRTNHRIPRHACIRKGQVGLRALDYNASQRVQQGTNKDHMWLQPLQK